MSKKNGEKKMVIDYHNLNDQTVKNNYPLLLIMDLIDNIGSKQVFTKIDLQWRFNNVKIKERNKQKKVFTIYIGFFELTVIFFGITNLPATFQVIINEILKDIINKGIVVAFIDNILVGAEIEKRYNKIVKKY